ncbi:unnamed protein product, partial [marine sediment metagenome]
TLLSRLIKDFLSPEIINEMTAVGGILILGIGFGLLEIKKIKIGNLLPAILVAALLVAIGTIFLAKYFFDFEVSENIWKFWPILIIALGVDQIFKSFGGVRFKAKRKVKEEEI